MKKLFILTFAILFISSMSYSAWTVIDSAEDTTYNIAGLQLGETLTLSNDAGDKTEGDKSLVITYDYTAQGAWYKNAQVEKVFTSPVDLTEMEYFSIDMNVVSSPGTQFVFAVVLIDEKGYMARYLNYTPVDGSGWVTRSYRLSDLHKNQWLVQGRAVNLKKIAKISYRFLNQANLASPGTLTVKLDNARFQHNDGLMNEIKLIDFDSYANDAALQADWQPVFAGATPTLETTNPYSGTKSIKLTADVNAQWTNYAVYYDLPSVMDLSVARYMKLAVYGDSLLTGYNPTPHIYLQDTSGERALAYIYGWSVEEEWTLMYLPFQPDFQGIEQWTDSNTLQWGGNSLWRQDKWDAGGWSKNIDLTAISRIYLTFEVQGSGTFPINNVEVIFDDIIVGYATLTPPEPSVKTYNVNYTNSPPSIDGTVSANEWLHASSPGATGFVRHDNNTIAATEDPEIKAVYDDDYLYILYQIVNNDFALDFTPSGGGRDPVGTGFAGDDFELFIAPGGNMAAEFYQTVFFPYQGDGICYVWDRFAPGGGWEDPSLWDGIGDQAAFSYDTVTKLLTIEYRIPWTTFNRAPAIVTGPPTAGSQWGVQLGHINNNPVEAVNWEPESIPGFASERPLGTWYFTTPLLLTQSTAYVTVGQSQAITAIGGIPPYEWSFSTTASVMTSAYCYINSTTGDNVVVTGTALGEVDLYCIDSNSPASIATVTIVVIPTDAPLYRDESYQGIRSEMILPSKWDLME